MLWLLWAALVLSQVHSLTFMGWQYDSESFQAARTNVQCLGSEGNWYRPPVSQDVTLNESNMPYVFHGQCRKSYYESHVCKDSGKFVGNHYLWKSHCNVPSKEFSVSHLCEYMNGRNLMIVGDSMSELFSLAFLESMGGDLKCQDSNTIACDAVSKFPSFNVTFVRNDRLSTVEVPPYIDGTPQDHGRYITREGCYREAETAVIECNWFNQLHSKQIGLLLLNKGAHYEEDPIFTDEVANALRMVTTHFPNVSVIYRNTPYGHEETSDIPPLIAPEKPWYKYHYPDFNRQNEIAREMIDTLFPTVVYLDFYTATILRKDSHRDYLHYCLPGPPLMWVQNLFYHTLSILESYSTTAIAAGNSSATNSTAVVERKHCGDVWKVKYSQFHHRQMNESSASSRHLLYVIDTESLDDQLAGVITALYLSVLSRRALLIHTLDGVNRTLEDAFNLNHLNLHAGRKSVTTELMKYYHSSNRNDISPTRQYLNIADDFLTPDKGTAVPHIALAAQEPSMLPSLNASHAINHDFSVLFSDEISAVVLTGHVPFAHELFKHSIYNETLVALDISPEYCYSCGLHYLFRPKVDVTRHIESFLNSPIVHHRWHHSAITKIGIDLTHVSIGAEIAIGRGEVHDSIMCARQLELMLNRESHEVLWYVLSSSLELKQTIADQYGRNKVIYMDHSSIDITHATTAAVADMLLLSKCDYVVTSPSQRPSFASLIAVTTSSNQPKLSDYCSSLIYSHYN